METSKLCPSLNTIPLSHPDYTKIIANYPYLLISKSPTEAILLFYTVVSSCTHKIAPKPIQLLCNIYQSYADHLQIPIIVISLHCRVYYPASEEYSIPVAITIFESDSIYAALFNCSICSNLLSSMIPEKANKMIKSQATLAEMYAAKLSELSMIKIPYDNKMPDEGSDLYDLNKRIQQLTNPYHRLFEYVGKVLQGECTLCVQSKLVLQCKCSKDKCICFDCLKSVHYHNVKCPFCEEHKIKTAMLSLLSLLMHKPVHYIRDVKSQVSIEKYIMVRIPSPNDNITRLSKRMIRSNK